MSKKYTRIKSFKFAFQGLRTAIKNEPNFSVQLAIATITLLLAVFLKLNTTEWLILVLVISSVLLLELVNTSIEAIVDLVSPEVKDQAKVAKDVAAAAVLISSISATIIGGFLFLPKIYTLFF